MYGYVGSPAKSRKNLMVKTFFFVVAVLVLKDGSELSRAVLCSMVLELSDEENSSIVYIPANSHAHGPGF